MLIPLLETKIESVENGLIYPCIGLYAVLPVISLVSFRQSFSVSYLEIKYFWHDLYHTVIKHRGLTLYGIASITGIKREYITDY